MWCRSGRILAARGVAQLGLVLGLVLGGLGLLGPGPASATEAPYPWDYEGRPGPEVYDFYNLLTGSEFDSNRDLDPFKVEFDEVCVLGEATGVVLLGSDLGMHNANDFGFYTDLGVGMDLTPVFSSVGPLGFAGPVFQASYLGYEGEAGFYLQAHGLNENLWHSEDDIDLDADTTWFDHMISYELPDGILVETTLGLVRVDGGRLIGWEDLNDSNVDLDFDFNDMMLLKGNLTLVPEPGTAVQLALGLLALAAVRRRIRG